MSKTYDVRGNRTHADSVLRNYSKIFDNDDLSVQDKLVGSRLKLFELYSYCKGLELAIQHPVKVIQKEEL